MIRYQDDNSVRVLSSRVAPPVPLAQRDRGSIVSQPGMLVSLALELSRLPLPGLTRNDSAKRCSSTCFSSQGGRWSPEMNHISVREFPHLSDTLFVHVSSVGAIEIL